MESEKRACDNGHYGIDQQVCTLARHSQHTGHGRGSDWKLNRISDDGDGKSCRDTLLEEIFVVLHIRWVVAGIYFERIFAFDVITETAGNAPDLTLDFAIELGVGFCCSITILGYR